MTSRIRSAQAADHIAGFCLLNDWSARDIQGWEYQPLGPFLGKSFCTTVSPWVVTPEAMAPFRLTQAPRPKATRRPCPICSTAPTNRMARSTSGSKSICSPGLKEKGLPPHRLSAGSSRDLYWTVAQLVTHHSSNGCNLRPGDIFGTGTISGTGAGSLGSLLEISAGGRQQIALPSGESRRFLEDGDTVIMQARCQRDGFASIGFGECRGTVLPAV